MSNETTRDVIIWEELPNDWQVKKLKHISLVQLSNVDKHTIEGQKAVLLCNYVDVYKNEKITSTIPFMQATATDEQISRLSIQKNDVLFTKDSETPEDIGVPALVDEDLEGVVCGYHLAMARPDIKRVVGNYLFRVLQSEPIKKYFFIKAAGMTRYGLDKQSISEVPIPLPSIKEQQAIADYLDRELFKIDSLIAAKERLLELLAEKRRAAITRAVTRGLNGDVSLRDSGVEWLGMIPGHWDVRKLKHIAQISYGVSDELDKGLTSGVPIISLPNVAIDGTLNLEEIGWTELPEENKPYFLLKKGDLLFNWRNGSSRHLGKTAYFDAEGEYTHVGFLLRIRFEDKRFESQYYHAFLNGLRVTGFFAHAKAMVNNTFNQSELENLSVMIPPINEQREIINYINEWTSKIDKLYSSAEQTINLLNERRTSLIVAAVSGRLKVELSAN